MKGDFSRDTFDPRKHYSRVSMQQGRVQLDADWNEQTAILLYHLRTLARDLIGPAGGPSDSLGFEIRVGNQRTSSRRRDLTISPGRYYVDGIMCENLTARGRIVTGGVYQTLPQATAVDSLTVAANKPASNLNMVETAPRTDLNLVETNIQRDLTLEALGLSYFDQSDYPVDPEFQIPDNLLAVLDVWERHICSLEDPDIREIALGGPDTAARARVVWQVKLVPIDNVVDVKDLTCENFAESKFWQDWLRQHQPRSLLRARAYVPEPSEQPCIVSPSARYRGAENQLYRVEVHRGSAAGDPTFKWSRENGSVVFAIQSIDGKRVTLESLGPDERFGLEVGDWVEVVDDDYTLLGKADPLLRIESIEPDTVVVTLSDLPQNNVGEHPQKHPMLRRWDQQAGDSQTGGLTLANDNAMKIISDLNMWLNLEDGVQIQFRANATYRSGDYWLIPARTESGDVDWPGPPDNPQPVAPLGIEHHYAPLALVSFDEAVTGNKPFRIIDLRHRFNSLALCCASVTLDGPSSVQQGNTAHFTVTVEPKHTNLTYKWEFTNGAAPSTGKTPTAKSVTISTAKVTGTSFAVKVTVNGLPPGCPNTAQMTCQVNRGT